MLLLLILSVIAVCISTSTFTDFCSETKLVVPKRENPVVVLTTEISKLLNGTNLLAIKNSKNGYFVPSTLNFFDGIKIQFLKYDPGCTSHLLPLGENDINILHQIYPAEKFSFILTGSGGVGNGLALLIQSKLRATFPIRIATDFYPENDPIYFSYLRFSLCADDARVIVSNPELRVRFFRSSITQLEDYQASKNVRKLRGLLGQDFIKKYSVIDHHGCAVFVDASIKSLLSEMLLIHAFQVISEIKLQAEEVFFGKVMSQKQFDDLEDEFGDGNGVFNTFPHDDEYYYQNSED